MSSKKVLIDKILKIKFPFKIKGKGNNLKIDYILADVKRKDLFGIGRRKVKYKAEIVFDDKYKKVNYVGRLIETNLNLGALRFFSFFKKQKGKLIDTKIKTKAYGIKYVSGMGNLYNYKLDPKEIKKKIKIVVVKSGWKFNNKLMK